LIVNLAKIVKKIFGIVFRFVAKYRLSITTPVALEEYLFNEPPSRFASPKEKTPRTQRKKKKKIGNFIAGRE
jgi:hypothetical protein